MEIFSHPAEKVVRTIPWVKEESKWEKCFKNYTQTLLKWGLTYKDASKKDSEQWT